MRPAAGKRHRLAVIAGAGAHHAARPFLVGQLRDEVHAAADLERPSRLMVFVLHPRAAPQPLPEERMPHERGGPQMRVDARAARLRCRQPTAASWTAYVSHADREVGTIADQTVDAPVEKPAHVALVVDRPHLHLQPCHMRVTDKARRHDPDQPVPLRHLVAAVRGVANGPPGKATIHGQPHLRMCGAAGGARKRCPARQRRCARRIRRYIRDPPPRRRERLAQRPVPSPPNPPSSR